MKRSLISSPGASADSAPDRLANTRLSLRLTRAHNLSKPAGALTLAQAAELMDAMGNLRAVCYHVFAYNGHEMPARYSARVDSLGLRLSVAQARQTLALWDKWTHRLDSPAAPLDSQEAFRCVEGFIWALADRSWTKAAPLAA